MRQLKDKKKWQLADGEGGYPRGLPSSCRGGAEPGLSAHLSSAITTASNMSCSTAMAVSRLSPGPRIPFILCSNRQLARRDHKRPDCQNEEATSVYAARSRAGKDGKLKKPKKKKKSPSHCAWVDATWAGLARGKPCSSSLVPLAPWWVGRGRSLGAGRLGRARCPDEPCFYFQNPNRRDRIHKRGS